MSTHSIANRPFQREPRGEANEEDDGVDKGDPHVALASVVLLETHVDLASVVLLETHVALASVVLLETHVALASAALLETHVARAMECKDRELQTPLGGKGGDVTQPQEAQF